MSTPKCIKTHFKNEYTLNKKKTITFLPYNGPLKVIFFREFIERQKKTKTRCLKNARIAVIKAIYKVFCY